MKSPISQLFAIIAFLFVCYACQQTDWNVENELQSGSLPIEKANSDLCVEANEALDIANNFFARYLGHINSTRSKHLFVVDSIIDDNGKSMIYIVNLGDNQGFVLVSATKKYYPILAYNDSGNFFLDKNTPEGLQEWLRLKKQRIQKASVLSSDSLFVFLSEWRKYENPPMNVFEANSSVKFELEKHLKELLNQWNSEGKHYAALSQAFGMLPDDVYHQWCIEAELAIFPLYEDYMNYSFVVEEYVEADCSKTKKNVFEPEWSQRNGFNSSLNRIDGELPPAGCSTIAMATVLRQYERPKDKYAWNMMPYSPSHVNTITADFVRDVSVMIHANYGLQGTGASLDNVKKSFVHDFGYDSSIELVNHTIERTRAEIDKDRVVIMQGFPEHGSGHAWVVSGYDRHAGYTKYSLWVPIYNFEVDKPYSEVKSYEEGHRDYNYIYIHWGWHPASSFNGFYLDTNPSIDNLSYKYNRKDIVNIIPPQS